MNDAAAAPFFKPWLPERFNGTLILAESHFKGDETLGVTGWIKHPDSEWPQAFITKYVQDKRDTDDPALRALRHSFVYDGSVLGRVDFWDSHAYSHLIPRLMKERDERPSAQDAAGAREQFKLIVAAVEPVRILIVSAWAVAILKQDSDDHDYKKVGDNDYWEMRFQGVPAVGIHHPNAWKRLGYTLERAQLATARLRAM